MSFGLESVQHNLSLSKNLSLSMYITNINTPWKVYAYSIYALVGLYQKSHSCELRTYRTHTFFMKYSIYMSI